MKSAAGSARDELTAAITQNAIVALALLGNSVALPSHMALSCRGTVPLGTGRTPQACQKPNGTRYSPVSCSAWLGRGLDVAICRI